MQVYRNDLVTCGPAELKLGKFFLWLEEATHAWGNPRRYRTHGTLVTENVLLHPGFPCTLLGPHRVTPGCEGTP